MLSLLRQNYFLSNVVLIKLFKSLILKTSLLLPIPYIPPDRFNYKPLLLLKILGHFLTRILAILSLFGITPAVQNGAYQDRRKWT